MPGPRRLLRLVFSRVPRGGLEDDQGPGRNLRMGLGLQPRAQSAGVTTTRYGDRTEDSCREGRALFRTAPTLGRLCGPWTSTLATLLSHPRAGDAGSLRRI